MVKISENIPGSVVGMNKVIFYDWISNNAHDAGGDARRVERKNLILYNHNVLAKLLLFVFLLRTRLIHEDGYSLKIHEQHWLPPMAAAGLYVNKRPVWRFYGWRNRFIWHRRMDKICKGCATSSLGSGVGCTADLVQSHVLHTVCSLQKQRR